jgi:hypothetical protein
VDEKSLEAKFDDPAEMPPKPPGTWGVTKFFEFVLDMAKRVC